MKVGQTSGRTTQLNSGGGRVSYELQKAYVPPPFAAAPGSACWVPATGESQGFTTGITPNKMPVKTPPPPKKINAQGNSHAWLNVVAVKDVGLSAS